MILALSLALCLAPLATAPADAAAPPRPQPAPWVAAPTTADAPSIPDAPLTRSAARDAARALLDDLRALPDGRRVAAAPFALAPRLAELAAFADVELLDPADALLGGPDADTLARLHAAGLALDDPRAGARAALALPGGTSNALALAGWHAEQGDDAAYRATLAALEEHLADAPIDRTTLTRLITLQTRLDRVDDALASVERLGRDELSRRKLDDLARRFAALGRWDDARALTPVSDAALVNARLQALHDAGRVEPMLAAYLEGRALGVDADAWTEIAVFVLTARDLEARFEALRPSDDDTAVTLDEQRWDSIEEGALPAGRAVRAARAGNIETARELHAGLDARRHWSARAAVEIAAALARAGELDAARRLAEGQRFAVPPRGRLTAPTAERVPLRERVAREIAVAELQRGAVDGALASLVEWGRPANASPGEAAAWLARSVVDVLEALPDDAAAHGRAFVAALLHDARAQRPWELPALGEALSAALGEGRLPWLAEAWAALQLEVARAALAASTRGPNHAREGFPESRDADTLAALRSAGGALARAGSASAWAELWAELPDDESRVMCLLGATEQLLAATTGTPADAAPAATAAAMLTRNLR